MQIALGTSRSAALQEVVDDLAALLGRPVLVRDARRPLQVSSGAPVTVARQRPGVLDGAAADPRDAVDIEVPVSGRGGILGHVVVLTDGGPPLQGRHLDALNAGVSLVRDVLDEKAPPGSSRADVLAELLVSGAAARRAALATALDRRWLRVGEGTVVRAVLVDASTSPVLLVALGRHLSLLRTTPLGVAGVRSSVLYLVGGPSERSLDVTIVDEASRRGIRVLGIGTASPAPGAADLACTAEEAARAADLSASLVEFQPSVDASALGGWLLLASTTCEPSHLEVISPAAHTLYFRCDELQRQTVEVYLDVGASVVAACDLLFVHRTTLYYRLERMPEVVRDALADGMRRSTLHLALKLIRLWEATGRL